MAWFHSCWHPCEGCWGCLIYNFWKNWKLSWTRNIVSMACPALRSEQRKRKLIFLIHNAQPCRTPLWHYLTVQKQKQDLCACHGDSVQMRWGALIRGFLGLATVGGCDITVRNEWQNCVIPSRSTWFAQSAFFSIKAIKKWNSLLSHIKTSPDLYSFSKILKRWIKETQECNH